MRKLKIILFVVMAAIACGNVSRANGISASLPVSLRPSFSHNVVPAWEASAHARYAVNDRIALVGSWSITLDPASPVPSGTSVTIYATYSGSDPTVGGTLNVEVRNASSTCYGAELMYLSCTLPANPTDGVPYNIGSIDVYNTCGSNKILKIFNIQTHVDGALINWQPSTNFVVTP